MDGADVDDADAPLPAGAFGPWLAGVRVALRGERASDVPCGGCTACCESHHFVHIEPDEHDTLANVPRALLFPAPQRPRGHVVLGYDEHGRCPMLVDGACSIYAHRPRACRTYDCRVLAAAGLAGDDQPLVAARVRRWRFDVSADGDRAHADAVRAAVTFLRRHAPELDGAVPMADTPLAVLAAELSDLFVDAAGPPLAVVRAEFARRGT